MSEDIKVTEKKCLCQNEFVRSCASVAIGVFVGGFCALNLYSNLNPQPMYVPQPVFYKYHDCPRVMPPRFDNIRPFDKKFDKQRMEKRIEFHKKMQAKKMENKEK